MQILKSCCFQLKNLSWVNVYDIIKYLLSTISISVILFLISFSVDLVLKYILKAF